MASVLLLRSNRNVRKIHFKLVGATVKEPNSGSKIMCFVRSFVRFFFVNYFRGFFWRQKERWTFLLLFFCLFFRVLWTWTAVAQFWFCWWWFGQRNIHFLFSIQWFTRRGMIYFETLYRTQLNVISCRIMDYISIHIDSNRKKKQKKRWNMSAINRQFNRVIKLIQKQYFHLIRTYNPFVTRPLFLRLR